MPPRPVVAVRLSLPDSVPIFSGRLRPPFFVNSIPISVRADNGDRDSGGALECRPLRSNIVTWFRAGEHWWAFPNFVERFQGLADG